MANTATKTRKPTVYTIPAGTKATTCSGHLRGGTCAAKVYWIRTPQQRPLLVSADVDGGKHPSECAGDDGQLDMLSGPREVFDGVGHSHFTDCCDADIFSKGSR